MNERFELECPWCTHKMPFLVPDDDLRIGDKGYFMCIKCQRHGFWMFTGERLATLTAVLVETPDEG